ncbi:MAG: PorV/PorQ family protein [Bacteroidetes bacterium]|nr:PorV/PorQ family protein [Bacteroidota bacterium]
MKKLLWILIWALPALPAQAGNPERTGQAGATQLLVNPYARSSGFHGMDVATTGGIVSVINNPAGLSHTKRTEVVFSHTKWLVGSDININAIGVSQRLGAKGGVLGLNIVSFDIGQIEITTIDQPDGGLGYFSPSFVNLGLSYAKEMLADRIFVGTTVKLVHESITDVSANGVAVDAGVQYHNRDQKFKLGVALRNVGPQMRYSGDGLAFRTNAGGPNFDNATSTVAESFEMPGVLMIGTSYTITIGQPSGYRYRVRKVEETVAASDYSDSTVYTIRKLDSIAVHDHKVTPMLTFVANAFQRDQVGVGAEYRFKEMVMIRAAYMWERYGMNKEETRNAFSGLAGGVTFELPFSVRDQKTGEKATSATTFAVDYSFRHTWFFGGTHSFGFRINL